MRTFVLAGLAALAAMIAAAGTAAAGPTAMASGDLVKAAEIGTLPVVNVGPVYIRKNGRLYKRPPRYRGRPRYHPPRYRRVRPPRTYYRYRRYRPAPRFSLGIIIAPPPAVYRSYIPRYGGSCSYWAAKCQRNWRRSADIRGCLRYHGCR